MKPWVYVVTFHNGEPSRTFASLATAKRIAGGVSTPVDGELPTWQCYPSLGHMMADAEGAAPHLSHASIVRIRGAQ